MWRQLPRPSGASTWPPSESLSCSVHPIPLVAVTGICSCCDPTSQIPLALLPTVYMVQRSVAAVRKEQNHGGEKWGRCSEALWPVSITCLTGQEERVHQTGQQQRGLTGRDATSTTLSHFTGLVHLLPSNPGTWAVFLISFNRSENWGTGWWSTLRHTWTLATATMLDAPPPPPCHRPSGMGMVCFPPTSYCPRFLASLQEESACETGIPGSATHQQARPRCSHLQTETWVRFLGFLPRVKSPLLLGCPSLPASYLRWTSCRLESIGGTCRAFSGWRRFPLNSGEQEVGAREEGSQAAVHLRLPFWQSFAKRPPSSPGWGAPAFSDPNSTGSLRQMTLANPRGWQHHFLSVNSHVREDPRLTTFKTLPFPKSWSQDLRLKRLIAFHAFLYLVCAKLDISDPWQV